VDQPPRTKDGARQIFEAVVHDSIIDTEDFLVGVVPAAETVSIHAVHGCTE
jgi:hypothetical protein